MVFITGGRAQGKLEYARKKYFRDRPVQAVNGSEAGAEDLAGAELICDLHEYIRRHQKDGYCELPAFRPDAVIICDEVGSGIVPLEKEERLFREAVGRAGCRLAEQAEIVELVRFGIPQRIKETLI